MKRPNASKTIAQLLEEFLSDQKGRVSAKTAANYDKIVDLYRGYL